MKHKAFFLVLLCLLAGTRTAAYAQQKISILGDSYSTFYGYVTPDTNLCWYGVPGEKKENDVTQVDETWWRLFLKQYGYRLECNNSYSGATICHTGYDGADYSDRSFVTRMSDLGQPDIILVFGVAPMTVGRACPLAITSMRIGKKKTCTNSVRPFAV